MSPGRKPSRSPASTAGRDRMMRSTVAALEQRRGMGDGEIGLAGAGRADAEDQLGAVHGAHIGVLRRACGRRWSSCGWRSGPAAILPLRSSVGSVSWSSAAIAMRIAPSTSRLVDSAALLQQAVEDVERAAAPARRADGVPLMVDVVAARAWHRRRAAARAAPGSGRTRRRARWHSRLLSKVSTMCAMSDAGVGGQVSLSSAALNGVSPHLPRAPTQARFGEQAVRACPR